MDGINRWIDYSKPTTPTISDFSFDHKKQFFRAVDWQHVLLHVAPTIIAPYLKSSTATDALMDLINACSISLQRSISPGESTYMKSAFTRWGDFLRREISADRYSMRVWTMNNHFAVQNVPELIKQQGPLRYFSCRSLERTIKKYSNMVRSMFAPDVEISNIHTRVNYYKEHRSAETTDSSIGSSSVQERDFLLHPTHPQTTPRLWLKIQRIELCERADFFGASTWQFINALQRYYSRLGLSGSVIDSQQITMAGSMLKDDVYYHSRLHRTNNTLLKRSNHLVLFEAKRASRYWYIGEVLLYFEHNLNGTSRFLALVLVMPDASMDEYGIIRVTYYQQRLNEQFMVCNTLDVITIIGLVRYNDNETDFKAIWPDAKYYQKLDGRIHREELL
ncbi:hypothetical protein A0J61_11339 [Choanephora cucurbitarum]|uniref:Uncharacterized protein n=1 Tax=Choanephora cucurbitarum TaxID=101091 RepID=A0A1C7MUV8_9FUNG|nr:hypothetical protein A0J61_11339 [Choanephora cucurbitarum]